MSFEFGLNQLVEVAVSGEFGAVKARAEYANGSENGYFVHYKAGDGRATTQWFDESDLIMVEAEESPGKPVFSVTCRQKALQLSKRSYRASCGVHY